MKRIMVIEDNSASRELIREVLEMRGYEVTEACNGLEALELVKQTQPDLVLLDLNMPTLDGFGVLRELRADTQLAQLPVIALTAYAMQGDRERILSAGCNAYLTKPIDFKLLSDEIARLSAASKAKS